MREKDCVRLSQKIYQVDVRGSVDGVLFLVPEMPDISFFGPTYDGAVEEMKKRIETPIPPGYSPLEYRRSHPGTHWHVNGDRRRVEIVREEWGGE